MTFVVPKPYFAKAFSFADDRRYEMFNEKVNKELEGVLHPSAVINNFDFVSSWKDAGGNLHTSFKGQVSGFGQQKEIGGEFVWLKNLESFRGRIWSSLEMPSDLQLLMMARDSYRRLEYYEAKNYLDAIQQIENVSRSAIKLKSLVARRIDFDAADGK